MIKILEDRIEYLNDSNELHRTDGPAIVWYDGSFNWYKNGEIHRLDGPAIENLYGRKEYWINNTFYLFKNFITHPKVIEYRLLMSRSKKIKAILK